MEQKRHQLKPTTPEQIEAEKAFAEKLYEEIMNVDPEKARETIRRQWHTRGAPRLIKEKPNDPLLFERVEVRRPGLPQRSALPAGSPGCRRPAL